MENHRSSRRQRVRQLKAELVAAYMPTAGDRSLATVRHFMPNHDYSGSGGDNDLTNSNRTRTFHLVDSIEQDPTLLWEPYGSGSTLMHWAAQHLRYEQMNHDTTNTSGIWRKSSLSLSSDDSNSDNNDVRDPWEWLLQHATAVDPHKFTTQQDGGGETCLDCFMSAWHNGSRRNDPYRFSQAVEAIREEPALLHQLETLVQRDGFMVTSSSSKPMGRAGDRRVTVVHKVWKAFVRLYQAARTNPNDSLVSFLARTGRSLESFAWLAVTLHKNDCRQPNAKLELPLHLWASSPSATTEDLDGLWRHLLLAYPNAVTEADHGGSLPIHRALHKGNKPISQVQVLSIACPATLGCPDPKSGLYPFAMAASVTRTETRALLRATERRHPSQRLYDWLDTCRRDNDDYEKEISTALLGHVYGMLRALPQALEHNRQAATKEIQEEEARARETSSLMDWNSDSHVTTVRDIYAQVLHDIV